MTLARCLVEGVGDLVGALKRYEDERLPPTSKIVMANRANGPGHVLQLAEERAPDGFENVCDVIPKDELEGIGATYKAVVTLEEAPRLRQGRVVMRLEQHGHLGPVPSERS